MRAKNTHATIIDATPTSSSAIPRRLVLSQAMPSSPVAVLSALVSEPAGASFRSERPEFVRKRGLVSSCTTRRRRERAGTTTRRAVAGDELHSAPRPDTARPDSGSAELRLTGNGRPADTTGETAAAGEEKRFPRTDRRPRTAPADSVWRGEGSAPQEEEPAEEGCAEESAADSRCGEAATRESLTGFEPSAADVVGCKAGDSGRVAAREAEEIVDADTPPCPFPGERTPTLDRGREARVRGVAVSGWLMIGCPCLGRVRLAEVTQTKAEHNPDRKKTYPRSVHVGALSALRGGWVLDLVHEPCSLPSRGGRLARPAFGAGGRIR